MKLRSRTTRCLALMTAAWLTIGMDVGSLGRAQDALDYLTDAEVLRVRQAQRIDWRVKVFMKIAERRLLLAEDPQAAESKRDEENWGPLPTGSRAEMLRQYGRAIQETILNFEDAYDRNPQDKHLLEALATFRQHTEKHLRRLQALRSRISDDATRQVLEQTLDDLSLAYEDARQSEQEFQQRQQQEKKPKKKKRT